MREKRLRELAADLKAAVTEREKMILEGRILEACLHPPREVQQREEVT